MLLETKQTLVLFSLAHFWGYNVKAHLLYKTFP